jgi:hypothetical protein
MRTALLVFALSSASALVPAWAGETSCSLHYDMSGGGAFYKHSTGPGQVSARKRHNLTQNGRSACGDRRYGHWEIAVGPGT